MNRLIRLRAGRLLVLKIPNRYWNCDFEDIFIHVSYRKTFFKREFVEFATIIKNYVILPVMKFFRS